MSFVSQVTMAILSLISGSIKKMGFILNPKEHMITLGPRHAGPHPRGTIPEVVPQALSKKDLMVQKTAARYQTYCVLKKKSFSSLGND